MAEGMPYFDLKPQRTPVESCEESLEDIEKQACLLFEEFLRLPHSSNTKSMLKKSSKEAADSPIIQEETGHYNYKQSRGNLLIVFKSLVLDMEFICFYSR